MVTRDIQAALNRHRTLFTCEETSLPTEARLKSDPSGLERLSFLAEIRAPEGRLPGLHAGAAQLSRPGLRLRVQTVDWAPSLAALEAARAEARAALYQRAAEEAARARARLGLPYQVGNLTLTPAPVVPPALHLRAQAAEETPVPEPPEPPVPPLPRAARVTLTATVVLRHTACPPTAPSTE
jgi:hypothetical protein